MINRAMVYVGCRLPFYTRPVPEAVAEGMLSPVVILKTPVKFAVSVGSFLPLEEAT